MAVHRIVFNLLLHEVLSLLELMTPPHSIEESTGASPFLFSIKALSPVEMVELMEFLLSLETFSLDLAAVE